MENTNNYKAVGYNLIVRKRPTEKRTSTGLYTNMSKDVDKVCVGTIVSVGPKANEDTGNTFSENDVIAFDNYSVVVLTPSPDDGADVCSVPARSVFYVVESGDRQSTPAPATEPMQRPTEATNEVLSSKSGRVLLKD
jgi:co-chaperonin GroES (HSP10)